jgi:aspartate/glutamate racemase
VFLEAGRELTQGQGCESVLLAGADLALVFDEHDDCGFDTVDCAAVHDEAIAKIANS